VEAAVARLAAAAAEDEGYWAPLAAAELEAQRARAQQDGAIVVDARRLAACHPALGKRVVREALREVAGSLRRFTHEHVETVWRLAAQPGGSGRVQLPRVEVWRSLHWLRFSAAGGGTPRPGCIAFVSVEPVDGQAVVRQALPAELCRYNVGSDLLDADKVSFPLASRGWQAADAYQPVGHRGEVKLKTLLASAGVPCWDRARWPILLSAGRIAWCRRFGGAVWAVAGPGCRRALLVRAAGE
jgi:tRNA(Ile)-lysidine synthase